MQVMVFLCSGPLVPANKKIEEGSEEGKENDEHNPYDLIVALKSSCENIDESYQRKEGDKEDDEKYAH